MKRLSPVLFLLLCGCASGGSTTTPPPPQTLQVTTTTIASANLGEIYTQQLTAAGGTGPYTWALVSGNLPPGITLSQSGVLSGRPTASGQFQFTAQVSDSSTAQIKTTIQIEWRST